MKKPVKFEPVRYDPSFSAKKLCEAADIMQVAFVWSDTPEGHRFWSSINRRLNEMADAAERERCK
jgi:hypothetical protein